MPWPPSHRNQPLLFLLNNLFCQAMELRRHGPGGPGAIAGPAKVSSSASAALATSSRTWWASADFGRNASADLPRNSCRSRLIESHGSSSTHQTTRRDTITANEQHLGSTELMSFTQDQGGHSQKCAEERQHVYPWGCRRLSKHGPGSHEQRFGVSFPAAKDWIEPLAIRSCTVCWHGALVGRRLVIEVISHRVTHSACKEAKQSGAMG